MSTIAPPALNRVYTHIGPFLNHEQRGGIVNAGSPGYHTSYEDLLKQGRSGDYSIQCPADKRGQKNFAAGIDITFGNLQELIQVHKRLREACTPDAAGNYDPRIECVREIIGTLDGRNVSGYNRVSTGSGTRSRVGWVSSGYSDSSHLWHEHISVLRDRANNENDMRGLSEVICGLAAGSLGWVGEGATPPPVVVTPPPYQWDGSSFPGAERFASGVSGTWVTWLGKRLVAHGWKGYTVGPGPEWGEADKAGVKWFQELQGWTGADADGVPGPETWKRLAADPKPVVVPPVVKPTAPKPTTPEVPVSKSYEITAVFANVLRRTDPEPGRLRWPARIGNIVKHIKSANPDVVLANELDSVTAADIAGRLGPEWRYQRLKGIGVFWNSEVFDFTEGRNIERLFSTKDNRYVFVVPVIHRASGDTIHLATSHLENDGDKATNGAAVRKVQAIEIAKVIGSGLWILGADLNSTTPTNGDRAADPSSKPRVILGRVLTFLSDQAGISGRAYASHHGGKGSSPRGRWIDDLAWKGFAYVKGALIRTDGTDASDHHFLSATLKFTK